jgi:hypothetical protein
MTSRFDLTMDCADAGRLAAFWKDALRYVDEPPPPPFRTRGEWLMSHGVPEEEWGQGAWLCDPAGIGPRLCILQVPEPKTTKNRLHIDLRVAGDGSPDERWGRVEREVRRLSAAGANPLQRFPKHHVVMADPEGNEFCVA